MEGNNDDGPANEWEKLRRKAQNVQALMSLVGGVMSQMQVIASQITLGFDKLKILKKKKYILFNLQFANCIFVS